MHDLHKQWDIEKNLPLLFSDVSAKSLLKQWIRKDLGLMPELTNNDMGGQAGFSETFTIHTVTNAEIINKINEIYLV